MLRHHVGVSAGITTSMYLGLEDFEDAGIRVAERGFRARDLIFAPGDPDGQLYFLLEGTVRLYKIYGDYKEATVAMLMDRGVFGELSLDEDSQQRCFAEAVTESQVAVVRKRVLVETIKRDPTLATKLLHSFSDRLRQSDGAIESLLSREVSVRLARLLLNLGERFGEGTGSGTVLKVRLTHQDLANMIVSTREAVSKVMSEFQRLGLIEVRNRRICLTPRLEEVEPVPSHHTGRPMSVAVNVGQPVRERFEAKPDEAQAPNVPSESPDAFERDIGVARKPRRGVAGAEGEARKRRYRLYADEDLMSLVGLGDAAAFAELYDRHGRAAYSLAHRMMGERQAAEDLAQDAFLKVWRSAAGYRSERGSVSTWILSIVRNRGIDRLRSLAARRRTQEKIDAEAPTSQPSEAFAGTWRNSQRDQVREALSTLPDEQLKILELAYFSGYTQVEIAQLLYLPLGTVKGRTRLGLKKLSGFFHSRGAVSRMGQSREYYSGFGERQQ